VSDGVSLDWPPSGETFWSLLGDEGGRLRGLHAGPEALSPEGRGKLRLLVSRLGRDPIGGAVGRGTPWERR
jgi:hypothetical protein